MSSEEPKDVEIPEKFDINFLEMSDGTALRVLQFKPENPKGRVFMYPGMNTLVLSWIKVLEGLSGEGYEIDYVESREKHTAKYPNKIEVSRERMLKDCVESVELLGLENEDYIALGSSLGSTTLIHCIADGNVIPKHAILVGPTPHFKVPIPARIVLPLINTWTYKNIGLPLLKLFILRKFTDENADPKQKRKYELALELAEPIRLKKTLRSWHGNKVDGTLEEIDGSRTTCYLIGASEDKLHPDDDTKMIADGIDKAKFVDLGTNTAAHDKPLIDLILDLE